MDYRIKVTPEELKMISTDVLTKVANARNRFEQISNVVDRTFSYWEGEGHDKAAEYYRMRKDDYERIFRAVSEHVNNLQTIAGIYDAAEKANEQAINSLPADVIF